LTEIISYEELRKLQNLERDNKSLQELSEDFFQKVKSYIKEKEKIIEENKDKDNVFAKQLFEKNTQELKNIKKILEDICSRRRRKVVLQALTNIYAKVHNTENMLPEEEELYNKVIELFKEYTEAFMKKFEEKQIEKEEEPKESNEKIVVLEDIPEFLWKDGKSYGPFEKNQIVQLPNELKEYFISQGKAKLLE